ncbi:MAG: DNA mismatch repair endonuclease MutL [Myxococcota bacterium]
MGRIRILPEALANRIAAGEVVERPASIVKELVENALDAEATRIEVEVLGGGIRGLSVTDDGIGLSPEDAELAFRRHATSKIERPEDLARVETLGFRGEALPSIASVARVRLQTREHGARMGVEVASEGEGASRVRPLGCPEGTRVEVAELFARVPARRKFLKSEVTEGGHILRWLERIALVRPDVHVSLARDGRSVFLLPATASPRERLIAALPASCGERLVPIEAETARARVTGFASPIDLTRGNTNDLYVYVNSRPVRDRLLLQAIRTAYRDALPPGRHPVVVLFVHVEIDDVDVNVHPAKWEVRFRDPAAIHALVRGAIQSGIGAGSLLRPSSERSRVSRDGELRPPPDALLRRPPQTTGVREGEDSQGGEPQSRPTFTFGSLRYVGAALGTYLIFERPGGLVLLDQHAAHERLLFEQLREAWFGGKVERQALLIPVWTELSRSSGEALVAHADSLRAAGFDLEVGEGGVRGGLRVGLRAVPAVLAARQPREGWGALLEETAAGLRDPETGDSREGLDAAVHHSLASAACHAAFRKGDRLDPLEVQALLEGLDDNVWFPACPHGRPILALLDEQEISRRFLRR